MLPMWLKNVVQFNARISSGLGMSDQDWIGALHLATMWEFRQVGISIPSYLYVY